MLSTVRLCDDEDFCECKSQNENPVVVVEATRSNLATSVPTEATTDVPTTELSDEITTVIPTPKFTSGGTVPSDLTTNKPTSKEPITIKHTTVEATTQETTDATTNESTKSKTCKMRIYYLPTLRWLQKHNFNSKQVDPTFRLYSDAGETDIWPEIYSNDFGDRKAVKTPSGKRARFALNYEVSFPMSDLGNEGKRLGVAWFDGSEDIGSCSLSRLDLERTEDCQKCNFARADLKASGTQMELQCLNG